MIRSKEELHFYIAADRIMNGYRKTFSIKDVIDLIVGGGNIIRFLRSMRYCAYYSNTCKKKFSIRSILKYYWLLKYNRLSVKLGFSIGVNTLGYGVVIPHYGTIVINSDARIGNYSVIHTCTCVAGGEKMIGDCFYLSTGSQIVGRISIGNGVTVAAHSLVNSSFGDNCLLAGAPAIVKRNDYPLWINGNTFKERMEFVNQLKEEYFNE